METRKILETAVALLCVWTSAASASTIVDAPERFPKSERHDVVFRQSFDLSRSRYFAFDAYVEDPGAVDRGTCYFLSGKGSCGIRFTPAKPGWNHIVVDRGMGGKCEGAFEGWSKIRAVMITFWWSGVRTTKADARNPQRIEETPVAAVVDNRVGGERVTFFSRMCKSFDAAGIPATVIDEADLSAEALSGIRLVALPGYDSHRGLKPAGEKMLADFAARGGKVLRKTWKGLIAGQDTDGFAEILKREVPEWAARLDAATAERHARAARAVRACAAAAKHPHEQRWMTCHEPFGPPVEGWDWDRAAKFLAENGITGFEANLCRAGVAFYESKVLPVSEKVAEKGDQLKAFVAACRKYGLECRVWRVCWNTSHPRFSTPESRQWMADGLGQVSFEGKRHESYLCPSAPENREREIASMYELAAAGVDAISFDYIRYPDRNHCFCERCRRAFEEAIGEKVANWPTDVRGDVRLARLWKMFRDERISSVVEETSRRVRRDFPKVKIVASVVHGDGDGHVKNLGQPWKEWVRRGWLDYVVPMDYFENDDSLRASLREQIRTVGVEKVRPILGPSLWMDDGLNVERLARQVGICREEGVAGFGLFVFDYRTVRDLPKMGFAAAADAALFTGKLSSGVEALPGDGAVDFHDVLVVGGTVKGVEAAIAARNLDGFIPERVQLLTPYSYLGEDMAGTLELGFGAAVPTGGVRRAMWESSTDHAAFDYWEDPKCTHPQFVYRNDKLDRLSEPGRPPSDGDTVYHYGDANVKCVLRKRSCISTVEVIVLEGKERHGDPGATASVTGEFLDGPRKGEKVAFVRREAGFDVGSLTARPVSFVADVGSEIGEFNVTVRKDPKKKCQYLSRIWFHLAGAERQVGVPSPLKVKRTLDKALVDAGVDFMTSTAIEDVIRGKDGKIVGVVAVNRSGRRTYRAKKVIDATRYGLLEGFGKPFKVGAKERFSRIVIAGGDNPPRAPGVEVEKLPGEIRLSHARRTSAAAYRYTMEIPMKDGSFASFAAAERKFREVTWNEDVLDDADLLVWHRRADAVRRAPPPPSARYDVVVVGGGTSGTPAAIAAARAGARVLLVEYLSVLGGVGTDGMICGYYDGNHCGFTTEFKGRNAKIMSGGYYARSETWRRMCEEAGVEVWYAAMGTGTVMDGSKVVGVRVGTEHGPLVVRATCVIDATGNGDIAASAGAATEFIGADEFALQSAGQSPHRLARSGINSDFGYLDDSNANDLWLFMLRARAGAPDAWDIAKMPDSRERRRIISDLFLSAQDVSANRPFPDTVVQALSRQDAHGYIRDIYAYVAPDSGTMKDGLSGRRRVQFSVNVPLRSLLPRGLSGIAVIGIASGVERDVQPIIRMQADLMNMGYSVGVAAAMAAANGGEFRSIDLASLRAKLVEKGILRREVLEWKTDTDVSSDATVAAAVASLKDDFKGADVIWRKENRARALPGLRAAYRAATEPKARQIYAEMLGMLGDATGVETLAGIVSCKIPVEKTRHGANFGEGNHGGDNMRGFMIALGRTRDARALEPLLAHLRELTPLSPLGDVRGATLGLGELGSPGAAAELAAKLQEDGNHGFAVSDWRSLKPQGGYGECPEMVNCLRELAYARALLRCGDFNGLARKTFTAYAKDPRGVLSAYARAVLKEYGFGAWPRGKDPESVARKVSDLFLTTVPDVYKPTGYSSPSGYCAQGYGRSHLHYSVVSLWLNLIELARIYGDEARVKRLVDAFEPFYGPKKDKLMTVKHVDFNIVGALPIEIAIATGDARARKLGLWYADRQWEKPQTNDIVQLWGELLPFEERMDWWRRGYTDQSRMWIDDMYMITVLQSQAYRLTGDRKYIDRAAKEMCVYLDRLQIKEGPDAGLFYHGPDAPFVWGRGAGWMAAGMPLLLKYLPEDSEYRAKIMDGYLRMMRALKVRQCASGMWNQLVGDAESWEEPSATAMFGYAFIEGVRNGWLDAAEYGEPARRAYLAVVDRMDAYGNVQDVCAGTPKKNDRQHYLDRPHVHGDPHAQAPLMWMCRALLEKSPK